MLKAMSLLSFDQDAERMRSGVLHVLQVRSYSI